MYVKDTELHLYAVTLQKKANYVASCVGHFINTDTTAAQDQTSSKDSLQIVLATESQIELYDVSESKFELLFEVPIFSRITAIESIKPQSTEHTEYLIILSDSGYISINEFAYRKDHAHLIALRNVALEPLYRSGLRRFSPIYSVHIDPLQKSIILNSQEGKAMCFLVNSIETSIKEEHSHLVLDAPIELSIPEHCIIASCVLQNSSHGNPILTNIEYDVATETLLLSHRMVDTNLKYFVTLNTQHLSNKFSTTQGKPIILQHDEHFIMALPALEQYEISVNGNTEDDDNNNSFFLINGDDGYIRLLDLQHSLGYNQCKVAIPTRVQDEHDEKVNAGTLKIVSGQIQKLKKSFFVLLQSDSGDFFKLVISAKNDASCHIQLQISYFETIPQSYNFHIFKNGLLLTLPELEKPALYQFESLGETTNQKTYTRSAELNNLSELHKLHNTLTHPVLSKSVISNNVPMTLKLSTRESVSIGVQFKDLITTNLQQSASMTPEQIWSIDNNRLIALGFTNKSTTFLHIEKDSINGLSPPDAPTEDNFFITRNDKTIYFCQMHRQNIIQVTNSYFIHFSHSESYSKIHKILKWTPPAGVKITTATHSMTQLCVALSNNEIVYFELSEDGASLNEFQDHIEEMCDHSYEIAQIALSEDEMHCSRLLVSTKTDCILKLYSLTKNETFQEVLSLQVVSDAVVSLIYIEALSECHIGLKNGIYMVSKIDPVESTFYDIRSKYLGTRPVTLSKLNKLNIDHVYEPDDDEDDSDEDDNEDEEESSGAKSPEKTSGFDDPEDSKLHKHVIAMHSNRSWVSFYDHTNKLIIKPIQVDQNRHSFKDMVAFQTENIKENGICSITNKGMMVIGQLLNLRENCISSTTDRGEEGADIDCKAMYVQETDHIAHEILYNTSRFQIKSTVCESEWYSHPIITAHFLKVSNSKYLFVSTRNRTILTFQLSKSKEDIFTWKLLHETSVGSKVHCMKTFREKLLVPIDNVIVLYTVGMSQLLRKSFTFLPKSITTVVSLDVYQDFKIAVADVKQSVTVCCFHEPLNQFLLIADDIVKKYCISVKFLDEKTVLVSDKFGGVSTLRIPDEADDIEMFLIKNYPNLSLQITEYAPITESMSNIMQCPLKLLSQNHFFYNDIITDWHVVEMCNMSDRPVIVGTGLQGSVVTLLPLLTRKETHVLSKLMENMRMYDIKKRGLTLNYCGRDHLLYTSILGPRRNIIDGDYCEVFYSLTQTQQSELLELFNENGGAALDSFATSASTSVSDIYKALNGIRTSCV